MHSGIGQDEITFHNIVARILSRQSVLGRFDINWTFVYLRHGRISVRVSVRSHFFQNRLGLGELQG